MNIAVNTRLLLPNKLEGIGWFTYETLKRIVIGHPEHTFYFIFDRQYSPEFIFADNVTPVVIHPQARHPFLFVWYFEWSVPRVLKKIKADVFLSPDGYLSLRTNVPQIAVFHDLNFEHYPQDLPWIHRRYYKRYFPKFAVKAARMATVSEFSKQDIQKWYKVPADSIDVVYNGVNEAYSPITDTEQIKVRNQYSEGKPYFVYIGAIHQRKNLKNLFLAFELFKKTYALPHKLIIVGARKWWTEEMQEALDDMRFQDEVLFTGRLNNKELNRVLSSATALTYVSYFEGFGIPIVEAFKCEVAVITSNVTSMPEVAGDAAILTNPFQPEEISKAMFSVATNNELRMSLIEKGKQQLRNFSWEKSAQLLWKCIEKALLKV
jgi:glycosyltransferase involved in cell wall biosynthesis